MIVLPLNTISIRLRLWEGLDRLVKYETICLVSISVNLF